MPITMDGERLGRVAGELASALDKRVRLPVIQHADAAGLAFVMLTQLDDAIEERTAEATADGLTIACAAGCTACCNSPLLVSEGEAIAVVEWLALPQNTAVKEAFLAAYPAWKRGVGDAQAAIEKARGAEQLRDAAIVLKQRAVMCAFNHEGLCSIYDARPARCRLTHALDDNTHCQSDSDGNVKYFEHARTEGTFEQQEPLRMALHQALRRDALELLPSAVARLLGTNEPGRNEPCPCGSGKKFKKCHGS